MLKHTDASLPEVISKDDWLHATGDWKKCYGCRKTYVGAIKDATKALFCWVHQGLESYPEEIQENKLSNMPFVSKALSCNRQTTYDWRL